MQFSYAEKFCFVVFIDQPTIPLGGESFLPHSKLLTLTRFVIRRAPLTVLTVGAALAHAQTFSPWERGVAVIRASSTLAGVKLGCIFSISSHEVVPSCHCTGDISYQVCNGSKLRADGREEVQSVTSLWHMLPSLPNSHRMRGKVWKIPHFKGIVVEYGISVDWTSGEKPFPWGWGSFFPFYSGFCCP